MSDVDISQLNLSEPDPIEWDDYKDAGTFEPPPNKGRYVAASGGIKVGATKAGKLSFDISPVTIIGPTSAGYELRYVNQSVTRYKNRNGSQVGDFLRACAVVGQPKTNQDYIDLMQNTVGRPFTFEGDWEAYCKEDDLTIKGQEKFPKHEDGTTEASILCPKCGKKLWARFKISRMISAFGDGK
jgi:hypothetical protein